MKINTKRTPGLVKETPVKMSDGGYTYQEPQRFKLASDLLCRFRTLQEIRKNQLSWKNIIAQYNRLPYKTKHGTRPLPNHGFLRGQIDKASGVYTDFATERKRWAYIRSDYGDTEGLSKIYSDEITNAFQRFCIDKWNERFSQVLLSVRDMLLFSKGMLGYLDPDNPMPESIDASDVWPDSNAGMFPKSFDILFVQRRLTAVELFRKMNKQTRADESLAPEDLRSGWRKSSVLKLLKSTSTSTSIDNDTLYMQYKENNVSQSDQDTSIDLVYCYVKEYHERGDEEPKNISCFIIPAESSVPREMRGKREVNSIEDDMDRLGYLYYNPYCYEKMDEVISIVAHTVCRNFYEDPSFAELIYTTARTYDVIINRILQACEDNMRVFLSSTSTDNQKKLQRARFVDGFMVLPPGMELNQQRIERPVMESMQVLQKVTSDATMLHIQHLPGGDVTAQPTSPKTATGEQKDIFEGTRSDAGDLKIFNSYMTLVMTTTFNRFVTQEERRSEHFRNFEKFKKYLKSRKVPDEAWKPENTTVESLSSAGAGSPSARLQAAQVTLQALAAPARSPGEKEAQREMIAAVQGRENVRFYLPDDDQTEIPEDSLIGLENDALSEPNTNPKNVPVLATQLHFRHIPRHLEDAELTLQMIDQLFQSLGQFNPDDIGIHLQTIMDELMGIDKKLGHTRAHIVMVGRGIRDKVHKDELVAFEKKLQQINGMQDKLEHNLKQVQDKRLKDGQQARGQDPVAMHKERMNALEFEQTKKMNELDLERAINKGKQLSEQSAENNMQSIQLQTVAASHKVEMQKMVAAVKIDVEKLKAATGK